jgi:hypothetical protein
VAQERLWVGQEGAQRPHVVDFVETDGVDAVDAEFEQTRNGSRHQLRCVRGDHELGAPGDGVGHQRQERQLTQGR